MRKNYVAPGCYIITMRETDVIATSQVTKQDFYDLSAFDWDGEVFGK